MKPLETTRQFQKLYLKLTEPIRKKVDRKLQVLADDYHHPNLSAKKMVNRTDIWEARVDYHYRITFKVMPDCIILMAVGTHAIYRDP